MAKKLKSRKIAEEKAKKLAEREAKEVARPTDENGKTALTENTHVLDPDGGVMIVLENQNAAFAVWREDIVDNIAPEDLDKSSDGDDDNPVEKVIKPEEFLIEEICRKMKQDAMRLPKRYFQVSAKHLALACPEFKELSDGWENFFTSHEGMEEIFVKNWDYEALLLLLHIFHCQHSKLPQKISLEMLAKVAVLVNRYQCGTIMTFFSKVWIGDLEKTFPTKYSRDLMLWLWIAWFFRLPDHFKKASSIAMSESDGLIKSLELPIPEQVIDKMNSRRVATIQNIIDLLYARREEFYTGKRGCDFDCSSIMYGILTRRMRSIGLSLQEPSAPYISLIHKELAEAIHSFTPPRFYSSNDRFNRCHVCADSSFKSIIEEVEAGIEGLDLADFDL